MSSGREAEIVERLLRESRAGGRTCVPVLGSGVNIQAAIVDGRHCIDDWEGLLRRVAREIRMSDADFECLPKSNLMRWETMVRQCAMAENIESYQAENALQKLVCQELREQEQASAGSELYGELLDAQFFDMVSLNFDRRVALHAARERFHPAPSGQRIRGADESIYRHSVIGHGDGAETRIWYPHGDTKKMSTLKFGVRKYGDYIAGLEQQRRSTMARWKDASRESGEAGLLPPATFENFLRCGESQQRWLTWPAIFLTCPLMFIGCSLAWDEWPLWWLMHQRARIHAHFPARERPATICLCVGKLPENLQGQPAGLEVVQFSSFDGLWAVVRSSLRK
jgi:hypothetical protein